jgi:hypothetical protein
MDRTAILDFIQGFVWFLLVNKSFSALELSTIIAEVYTFS